jgi:hypothetical protein
VADFETMVRASAPEIRELAVRTREWVLARLPEDVLESVDGTDAGYGWTRGYRGLICVIGVQVRWVNLGFADGATLPDPHGLLRGSGKRHRFVRIEKPADLDHPGLAGLVEAAVAAHPPPAP